MSSNATSIVRPTDSKRKRKVDGIPFTKKLRSKIPRRKRFHISPIPTESSNSVVHDDKQPELSALQAASSSSSCFPGEISSLSTWISTGSETNSRKPRSTREKKSLEDVRVAFRPITRLYAKQKEYERDLGVELSESSCVESTSGVAAGVLVTSDTNLKNEERIEVTAASDAVSLSEISCVQQETARIVSEQGDFDEKTSKLKDQENDEVSTVFLLKSKDEVARDASVAVLALEANRAQELSFTEISQNNLEEDTSSEYSFDEKPNELELQDYSLACSEELSYGDNSEYSTELEIESELFPRSCSLELSDYSPSMFIYSPEKSSPDSDKSSTPPIYFPFFLRYQKHFTKLNSSTTIDASAQIQDELNEFVLMKFANEEYEESYKKFRSRERKLVLHDYTEEYSATTEFGELVLQQRLLMVNWIVERSKALRLQVETMFLGVSLLDRFLSRGFFKHKRKLQVLGIACLALATRLEENQPYNCVRQSAFYVGKNVYSRFEVVGMEWLVQEVLNFQCFLPTIHNFLWFYLKAAKANAEVERKTKYLARLSLLDHERLWYWPSTVAAALVILASLAANQDSSCHWVMETHVRTKDDDLPECIQSLEWLVKYVS